MFQRDYIMRNVEQLGPVLAAILKTKVAGELEEAEVQIATAGMLFLGFDVDLIRNLSEESVLELVRQRDEGDAGAYVVAAELLREQGDLLELTAGADAGHDSYVKSLSMYLEGWHGNPVHRTEAYSARITELYARLKPHTMSNEISSSLMRYFETTGEYAHAEDVLFRRVGGGDDDLIEHGIGFYTRLLSKPDRELVDGELPRDEVEEGLATLRKMIAPG